MCVHIFHMVNIDVLDVGTPPFDTQLQPAAVCA